MSSQAIPSSAQSDRLPSDDPAIVRRTQLADLARGAPMGVLAPYETTILLTIAIKSFGASGSVKGLIAAAGGIGMLLSPFATAVARRLGRPTMLLAATAMIAAAAGFAVAAIGPLVAFAIGGIAAIAAINTIQPLLIATYERNFPVKERGRRVGRGLTVRVVFTAISGLWIGAVLKRDPQTWRWVMLVAVAACLLAAAFQSFVPSEPLARVEGVRNRPWPHFHLLAEDAQLRITLIAWMLMGFGNLMLLPLRVEYLAVDRYGIGANAAKITLLTVTIPAVVRLVCMPFFGAMFDRVSFFAARILVNLLFALYVAAFFSGSSNTGLMLGAVALGVATAGGDLMWSLWVTKFAPPGRVADYMGLHTFFTGIRAVIAPLLAFAVVERFALHTVAWGAAALMVVSAAVLLPEARRVHSRRLSGAS